MTQSTSRTVYVNGEYLPEENAKISVFDRGFLFADGVYEVCSVIDGKLVDNDAHMARLDRSLTELRMTSPSTPAEIFAIQKEMLSRNNLQEGMIYLQITRGAADRDFAFPKEAEPSLVMFTQARSVVDVPAAQKGLSVITLEDIRWGRRDIKTVQLLAPSLAKQAALDAGADDAWMVTDGMVNEGTSNNAFIVDKQGRIITRNLGNEILHGITRKAVLAIAAETGTEVIERPFSIQEALDAREAFITSASAFVMPVVRIDRNLLGNGAPGILTTRLRKLYIEMAKESAV